MTNSTYRFLQQYYKITVVVAMVLGGAGLALVAAKLLAKQVVPPATQVTHKTAAGIQLQTGVKGGPSPSPTPTTTPAPSPTPATTASNGNKTVVGSSNGSGTSQSGGSVPSTNPLASLPLIPWEGGPAYWNQFPVARAAGWNNPNFFPFVIWYDTVSSDQEVQGDKSYGINTYVGPAMDGSALPTDYNLYARNGAFTLDKLQNTPTGGAAHPGLFLIDEPDGRTTSAQDLQMIRNLEAAAPNDGTFKYINFSGAVISKWNPQQNQANFEAMVNSYAGPASVDHYWYTQPSCSDVTSTIVTIDPGHCRTSSSYGASMRALRLRDAADGQLKPMWNFIENMGGGPDAFTFYAYIEPGQLEGAVMDSVINEARGIAYFNQAFSGSCQSSNVLRTTQTGQTPCSQPQMNAMKEVSQRIKALAPVINTQSYSYSFGPNLDTMLKWYNGSAYVFAMISGDVASQPGGRTFTLPAGLASASRVEVLNESRTIPVSSGRFSDNFAQEYSYHIYKVTP